MTLKRKTIVAFVFIAQAAMFSVVSAETVHISNQGDALSMDPRSFNETLEINVTGNMFEGLAGRGKNMDFRYFVVSK
jgi:peptide/nickel transport system substrate-binding protein